MNEAMHAIMRAYQAALNLYRAASGEEMAAVFGDPVTPPKMYTIFLHNVNDLLAWGR
jgi:hypothetical protein